MATANNNSYSVSSGQELYVGIDVPTSILNQTENTWVELTLTDKLSDIDPENDPLINPNHPAASPWKGVVGQPSMISAWCGAAYNLRKDDMWFPLQEGHGDGGSNAPYKISCRTNPTATIIRNPSGAVGNVGVLDDGQEATGVYFDGRRRATHSYCKHSYIPNLGPFMAGQGNTFSSALAGTNDSLLLDEVTGEMTVYDGAGGATTNMVCSTYDSSRHGVWGRKRALAAMSFWSEETRSWSILGANQNYSSIVSMTYIPEYDVIFICDPARTNGFAIFDCVDYQYYEPPVSGSFTGYTFNGDSQWAYVPDGKYLAVWDNTTDTTIINTLTIPSNPRTGTWVKGQLAVDASNTVTPTVRTGNGTYSRFQWSQNMGGFVVINATNENPYFFKVRI